MGQPRRSCVCTCVLKGQAVLKLTVRQAGLEFVGILLLLGDWDPSYHTWLTAQTTRRRGREPEVPGPGEHSVTHLDASLLRVRLHGLQGRQRSTALHDDPAVLGLSQGQNAECRAALLTDL